jgi:hypothetical protein
MPAVSAYGKLPNQPLAVNPLQAWLPEIKGVCPRRRLFSQDYALLRTDRNGWIHLNTDEEQL